jgi:hypothetical protein
LLEGRKKTTQENEMSRFVLYALLVFLIVSMPKLAASSTIDVFIKGFDDGVMTNKQKDYTEAVMNAKLQAIEQAGVEVKSITRVVNFELQHDMVESNAEAVLLPGFEVIDKGYQTDGTYQVVLIGKVQTRIDDFKGEEEIRSEIQGQIYTVENRIAEIERIFQSAKRKRDRGISNRADPQQCIMQKQSYLNACLYRGVMSERQCIDRVRPQYSKCIRDKKKERQRIIEDYELKTVGLLQERNDLRMKLNELRIELTKF